MRTWAIGDVHGCFSKLASVLDLIPKDDHVVFLGDYIDRGHQNREVVEFVIREIENRNPRYTFLVGNHEELFLHHMAGEDREGHWMMCGGDKTMAQVPQSLALRFASACKTMLEKYETDVNYFVHGGMSPGVPFQQQNRDILLWYRPPDHDDYNHGKFLVHGHTPVKVIDERKNRVNIDTGAVFGYHRKLTAVRLSRKTGKPKEYVQSA